MDNKSRTHGFKVHRPISIHVTRIMKTPDVRDLPVDTLLIANLKLDIAMQDELIDFLLVNRDKKYREPVLAITIEGLAP